VNTAGPAHARMHVEEIAPAANVAPRVPIVFVHGGHHTGRCWEVTPDGRIGWAPYAAQHGHPTYVIDWPARGRSPERLLAGLSLGDVAEGVAELARRVGPAVLVTHSMGGMAGWKAAELAHDYVAGVVGIAPGPPANLQPSLASADILPLQSDPAYGKSGKPMVTLEPFREPEAALAKAVWANTERFPHDAFEVYYAALVPESGRALNERNNIDGSGLRISGPEALAGIPKVVITGDSDTRHPRPVDQEIADYLKCEFIWLADRGITGRGHMLMIERGNLEVADLVLEWIAKNVK
jgi:pimeloyl-ACP methyl ester carboxylesterase